TYLIDENSQARLGSAGEVEGVRLVMVRRTRPLRGSVAVMTAFLVFVGFGCGTWVEDERGARDDVPVQPVLGPVCTAPATEDGAGGSSLSRFPGQRRNVQRAGRYPAASDGARIAGLGQVHQRQGRAQRPSGDAEGLRRRC